MEVTVLEAVFFIVRIYEENRAKYMFNNRCLIFSREGARKFSSESAALRFLRISSFNGLKYEIERIGRSR